VRVLLRMHAGRVCLCRGRREPERGAGPEGEYAHPGRRRGVLVRAGGCAWGRPMRDLLDGSLSSGPSMTG
jgi:hypothetical protein